MKPMTTAAANTAKAVSRWGAIAATLATISFAPNALAQFQSRQQQPQDTVRIESAEPAIEAIEQPPQDFKTTEKDPDVSDGGEGIDDPWTWFCLVNFPPEEFADCEAGIP